LLTPLVLLALANGLIFGLWPELDLAWVTALRGPDGFHDRVEGLRQLRAVLYFVPTVIMAMLVLLWLAARLGARLPKSCRIGWKAVLYLAVSLALGPGLLVNVGLKDHWHRPRPVQVVEFGGPFEFRPWYRIDGQCRRNCSFVSGEVAASAWLIGAASLAPPPVKLPAVALAAAVTSATALLRVAFGGHFPSDVLFAALFTLILMVVLRRFWPATEDGEAEGLRARDPHL
jgi:membrane-associated phospholipid phosphatase